MSCALESGRLGPPRLYMQLYCSRSELTSHREPIRLGPTGEVTAGIQSTEKAPPADTPVALAEPLGAASAELARRIRSAFGQPVAVFDLETASFAYAPSGWPLDEPRKWARELDATALRGRARLIVNQCPIALLACPIPGEHRRLAMLLVLTGDAEAPGALETAAERVGCDPTRCAHWFSEQSAWPAKGALRLLEATLDSWLQSKKALSLEERITELTGSLISTFDELNLLHRLTERITLSQSARELCEQSVRWLASVMPAECIVAHWGWNGSNESPQDEEGDTNGLWYTEGHLPLPLEQIDSLFGQLGPDTLSRTSAHRRRDTVRGNRIHPDVSEYITAPILANDRCLGWIAAINHQSDKSIESNDFGVAEESLLSSVATILGVHAGNRRFLRSQAEFFSGSIRALIGAIDAKDPYTCGHSDRVAKLSVRLGGELGLSEEELDTLYLGGLLHDIGKIAIDDRVLCKPGKLTREEFELIKTHPVRGRDILAGTPQLEHILPIVLHHHESWDGGGYPEGLTQEECPRLARITAVADALDAMASNRVYRSGMPFEKIDAIFKEGAGRQWDPEVVRAYFDARDDLLSILREEFESAEQIGSLAAVPLMIGQI